MRSFSIALFLVLLTPALVSAEPRLEEKLHMSWMTYVESVDKAAAAYRKEFSEAIRSAEKLEVYLLDFEMEPAKFTSYGWEYNVPEDKFPIVPYEAVARILDRKTLSAEEVKLLMPSLQTTIALGDKPAAGCHFPIHGLRIRNGEDQIVFQSSFCYFCRSFYMCYPLSDARWANIGSADFQKVMEHLMPIPKAEQDRFDAKYPPTPTSQPSKPKTQ